MLALPAFVGAPAVNKVYNVDALTLLRAMPSGSVDLLLTDIPYGEVNRESNGLRLLDKGNADTVGFSLPAFLAQVERVVRGSFYIFCGIEQVSAIKATMKANMAIRHCIWEKTNPSPMNGEYIWLSSIENCIYGKRSGAPFNEFCSGAVWRYPVVANQIHPTQKPIELFERLILASTNPGDLVVDPFCGSGTSGVAARNTKRNYLLGDLTAEYVGITRDRLRMPFELAQAKTSAPLSDLPLFAQVPA